MKSHLIAHRLWFILAIFVVRESTCLRGPWLTVPSVVKAGDTVTLSCDYDLENTPLYSIKWYWNSQEFFRYVPQDTPLCKHFLVDNIELSRSGPTQVTLKNVKKAQSGRYECEVSLDAPSFETGTRYANLTVVVPPNGEPSMKISHDRINIGSTLYAECSVPASDPVAKITWSINNEELSGFNESVKILPYSFHNEGDLIGVSSKIEITTDRSHFIEDVLDLKCETNIHHVWNKTLEMKVLLESPLKKVAELTVKSLSSQQRQTNEPDTDIYNSSNSSLKKSSFISFVAIIIFTFVLH